MSSDNFFSKNKNDSIHRQYDDWDDVHNQMLEVQNMQIQKKSLAISNPGDSDEKEADDVARKVASGESASIHGTGGTINRKGEGDSETVPEFQAKLESSKVGGKSLDKNIAEEMGTKMGADFSEVKVHTGSEANQMSESINARAFTHGQDIYFKDGQLNNSSREGKELLAHELVHTVQQGGGNVNRKIQRKPGDPQWEQHTATKDEKSIFSIALKLRDKYAPVVKDRPMKSVAEISDAIIAHNGKDTVAPGDTIEIPTKAYFEGLGAVPDLKQTDVTMHGGKATSPQEGSVLFKESFEPGSEENYKDPDSGLSEALTNRTHFSNVDPLLEPYLKNLAASVVSMNLRDKTSITVAVNFTQMGFTAENFIPDKTTGEKKGALDEIKTDRMYRITTQGDFEKQHIYIEGLGPVKTVIAQMDQDFLKKFDIDFVDNIPLNKKAYPDVKVRTWNELEPDEKTQVTGAFLKMPDAVLETVRGLRIGRAEMSQEHAEQRKLHYVPTDATPDTLAAYYIAENAIVVYDESFKNSNTVMGDATSGTTSYLEAIIMHEIGHAEDMISTKQNIMETPAYKEYTTALAEYRKVQDDADAIYLPKMKDYLGKKAELDYARTEAGKEVEKSLAEIENKIIVALIVIDLYLSLNSDVKFQQEANRIKGTLNGNEELHVPPLGEVCRTAAQDYDTSKVEIKEASLRRETLSGISEQTTEIADELLVFISAIKKEEALLDLQIAAEVTLDIGVESEPEQEMTNAFPDAKLLLQLALKHHPDQVAYKAALSSITPGEDGKPDGEKLTKLKESITQVNTDIETSGTTTTAGGKLQILEGDDPYATTMGIIPPEENMDANAFQVAVQKDFGDYKEIGTENDVNRPTAYADTNIDELYAESFMLYFSDPERFAKLRPHLYMYFENKYHRWEGKF